MSAPTPASARRVNVRGVCAAGHVTERQTEKPRQTTWTGTCSADGCDLTVKARRTPAAQKPADQAPTPAPSSAPTVKEVTYDAPQPKPRGRKQPDPEPGADDGGPAPDPAGGPDPEQPVVHAEHQPGSAGDGAGVVGESRREQRARRRLPRYAFRSPLDQ
ncbi:putative membrane protein [Nocardioides salarius]|uniref:Membrane protein n=1 Tax=Nocardioides salarius TaxID=374513 RepID=A0ABS2MFU7_9ACTN|nr:hypothetical protein [Nocardioides salarius]MBM7510057.1 putative membrane protein [Nocardioides salarius]